MNIISLDELLEKVNVRSYNNFYSITLDEEEKEINERYIQQTLEMLYDGDVIYSEHVYHLLLDQSLNFGTQITPAMIYQNNINDILSGTL